MTGFLDMCSTAWMCESMPEGRDLSLVCLPCKKGDPTPCDQCLPLSLQRVVLKAFSAMLKNQLLAAGVGERMCYFQLGFWIWRGAKRAFYVRAGGSSQRGRRGIAHWRWLLCIGRRLLTVYVRRARWAHRARLAIR